MRFHNLVEHIIHRIQKPYRTHSKQSNQRILPYPPPQGEINKVNHQSSHQSPGNPEEINRNKEINQVTDQKSSPHRYQNHLHHQTVPAQNLYQERRNKQHHQKYQKLSQRRNAPQHIRKLHGSNKEHHCTNTCKQDVAGHTLAIQHQKEGQVHQRRTRLLLHHNQQHRQQNQPQGKCKVADIGKRKSVGTHKLCHRQCRGKLGKLGRLQADGPQHQPGTRTLDVGSQKNGGDKQ